MISKEFDSVQFPGLTELLEESTYFNIFQDPQDRALLRALLHNCINEKVLTTNRYKFSASADFFVPNKTLYRDYVEFVKVIKTLKGFGKLYIFTAFVKKLYIIL